LALAFYQGTALAVVGLPRKVSLRKSSVKEKVRPVLLSYMDSVLLDVLPKPGEIATSGRESPEYQRKLQEACAVAIEFLVGVEFPELLYGPQVYGRYEQAGKRIIFLEVLEPYIISGQVKAIPAGLLQALVKEYLTLTLTLTLLVLLQALVEEYQGLNRLRRVELCILNLEVSTEKGALVDLDQLCKLCIEHSLLMALIHVCNNGLRNYTKPLELMSGILAPRFDEIDGVISDGSGFSGEEYLTLTLTLTLLGLLQEAPWRKLLMMRHSITPLRFS